MGSILITHHQCTDSMLVTHHHCINSMLVTHLQCMVSMLVTHHQCMDSMLVTHHYCMDSMLVTILSINLLFPKVMAPSAVIDSTSSDLLYSSGIFSGRKLLEIDNFVLLLIFLHDNITTFYTGYSFDNTVYDFDGEGRGSYGDLSSMFDCVKGNNARTISFEICTKDDRDNLPIIATGQSPMGVFQIVYNCSDVMKRGVIGLTAYSADYFPPTGTVINDGKWHKVVVTYDGATLRIYVDGRLDNASAVWNNQSKALMAETMNTGPSNNIFVGCSLWENPFLGCSISETMFNRWKGQLRNVKFYNIDVSNVAISVY